MSDSATTPHLPTGSTRTIMIVVLLVCNVLACFLEMLMNIALDHIATQYDIRLSLANWVVLGFAIVNATAITTAASLLRRFGIRKIMLTGCLFALAGSLLGFFATSFPLIVVARLIQAVTTGLFFPVVNEALFTLSPKGKAGILLSANSAVCGFAFALTPPIAGLVLTYGGLKALFLVPAACALVLGVVCYFTLHNIYARVKRKIDIPSLVLSFVGLGAFMCGLNEVAHDPLPSIVLMLFGAVMIAVFVRRQLRIPTPLLDLRPFKYQVFSLGETLIMIAYMGSLFVSLVVPLYLEGVQGETPFIAGCLLSIPICTYATLCIVSGKVLSKRGIWPLVSCGFGLAVLGFILVYGGVSLGEHSARAGFHCTGIWRDRPGLPFSQERGFRSGTASAVLTCLLDPLNARSDRRLDRYGAFRGNHVGADGASYRRRSNKGGRLCIWFRDHAWHHHRHHCGRVRALFLVFAHRQEEEALAHVLFGRARNLVYSLRIG